MTLKYQILWYTETLYTQLYIVRMYRIIYVESRNMVLDIQVKALIGFLIS